jgi:membrane fusion protein (multidrug efflux system)
MKRKIRYPYSGVIVVSLPGICSLLPLLLAGLLLFGCGKEQKTQPQAPIVEVVEVTQKDVPVYAEWVGTTDGLVNATIRAQVQGYLIKQNYTEGDFVKKDQVLFEIDPREYQAALDQTRSALQQSKAALEQAKADVSRQEARWDTAKANLKRIRPLAEQNAVSQKDLDDAVGLELSNRSAVDAAKAAVIAAEAQVLGAQAAVEKAQLNLGFTRVTSPIDGIAGIAKAQIGNLVGPGSIEELTTVSTIDPIKCYVSLSEQEYMRAMERRSKQQVGKVPLELILSDGTTYPQKGEFAFADRQVDVRTGTIRVATTFPNPQKLLRPGMFSRVRAEMGIRKGALLIPQVAVSEVQGKYFVAVVSSENKVSIKPIKVGQWFGQLWVIDEGLQAGEKVVAEGTQKVREGMVVSPKPFSARGQAESGVAQKPEAKPEAKSEAKSQGKPEAKPQPKTEKR